MGKVIVVIIILIIVVLLVYNYATVESFDAKLVQTYVDRGNTFLVFQKDNDSTKESFENEDSIWFFKFNSNDFLANCEIGKTYKVKVNGLRIPLFSSFRNIISMEEIE